MVLKVILRFLYQTFLVSLLLLLNFLKEFIDLLLFSEE